MTRLPVVEYSLSSLKENHPIPVTHLHPQASCSIVCHVPAWLSSSWASTSLFGTLLTVFVFLGPLTCHFITSAFVVSLLNLIFMHFRFYLDRLDFTHVHTCTPVYPITALHFLDSTIHHKTLLYHGLLEYTVQLYDSMWIEQDTSVFKMSCNRIRFWFCVKLVAMSEQRPKSWVSYMSKWAPLS